MMSSSVSPDVRVSLREAYGTDYDDFIHDTHFYRICMGSKGSKKSKTAALNFIDRLMRFPQANLLVVRKVYGTLKQSCFTDLLWAIDKLGLTNEWETHMSPLEMTRPETGQMIIFRGMDKAEKLASVTVRKGYLCWVWIEEFYEITNEEEFLKLEFSIRGKIPPESGLFKQITCTFNPWSECWIKDRFFDRKDDKVFTKVTTYRNNEFLGPDDIARYEDLRERNPRAARVICDGNWGVAAGLVYENWEVTDFILEDVIKAHPNLKFTYGIDFGYAVSHSAFVAMAVDTSTKELWVFDEVYGLGMSGLELAKAITKKGYDRMEIWADSARPDTIHDLKTGIVGEVDDENGGSRYEVFVLPGIRGAIKGHDSVERGIDELQGYRWHVHRRCINCAAELASYCYEQDKDGKFTGKPEKENDHCMDAARYAMVKLFTKGHGKVAEARGGDHTSSKARTSGRVEQHQQDSVIVRKRKRVFST